MTGAADAVALAHPVPGSPWVIYRWRYASALHRRRIRMYGLALLLHILAATIWTGGHIVLSVVVLPRVLRERSPARLSLEFESVYEKIGMPALIIQVITGLYLAYRTLPDVSQWLDFPTPSPT